MELWLAGELSKGFNRTAPRASLIVEKVLYHCWRLGKRLGRHIKRMFEWMNWRSFLSFLLLHTLCPRILGEPLISILERKTRGLVPLIFLEFSFVAHTMSKNPGSASYQHLREKDYGTRPSVATKLISRDRWRFGNLKQRVCIFGALCLWFGCNQTFHWAVMSWKQFKLFPPPKNDVSML